MESNKNNKFAVRVVVWILLYLITALVCSLLNGELSGTLLGGRAHEKDVQVACVVPADRGISWKDIGGLKIAKDEMWYGLVLPLRHHALFFGNRNHLLRPARGILLVGPPGTGKTMLARAAAKESGATFLAPTLATIEQKYYGESSKMLAAIFGVAVKFAPSVIFFDEIDGICRTRQSSEDACTYGVKTELLRQIDSLPENAPVLVVACTNNALSLDPALKRRLPNIVDIPPPSERERFHIFNIVARKEPSFEPALCKKLCEGTNGFTGSDISTVHRTACSLRLRRVLRDAENKDKIDAKLTRMPPLVEDDWVGAVSQVLKSKQSGSTQHVGAESTESIVRSLLRAKTS